MTRQEITHHVQLLEANAERIKLEPGEVLHINLEKQLPVESLEDISTWMKDAFPNNKVFVTHGNVQLTVIDGTDDPEVTS